MLNNSTAPTKAYILNMLSKHMDAAALVLDKELNVVFISQTIADRLGMSSDDIKIGDKAFRFYEFLIRENLLAPEDITKEFQRIQKACKVIFNGEIRYTNTDIIEIPGKIPTFSLSNGHTYRVQTKILGNGSSILTLTDVSEIVEKDTLLEKALSLGQSGFWALDVKAKTYTVNKSLRDFIGPERMKKIEDNGILELIHEDYRASFCEQIRQAPMNGGLFKHVCESAPSGKEDDTDSDPRWWQTNGQIIRNASGEVIRIESFVKDVTQDRRQALEFEKAKDNAIAANQAKSEFLANMSHEIRTPMNGILGMAELLSHSEMAENQREYVNIINNSASALLNIINDILDFSKIEAGAFELDSAPFNLKAEIDDVASLIQSSAQDKNLEVIVRYPPTLPHGFLGDAGRIRQVVTNLIGNAVKFTHEGHVMIDVEITTTRDNTICKVDITDTGIGIPPEKMAKIFDKFTQADGSTTRLYGGTGLGLTISKHIIEMMGGRMHVTSVMGEGSTFGFRIPLPLNPDAEVESFDIKPITGKRALIIDDIHINRAIFSEQLRNWGLISESCEDAIEAMTMIKTAQDAGQPYDLLLLDYLMPGMNGQEFAELLTKTQKIEKPKIIMLSSCDQPVTTQNLAQIGIDNYLVKPVRERRLFDEISRTLSRTNPAVVTSTPLKSKFTAASHKQEILVAEDFLLNRDVVKFMLLETPFVPVFAENGQIAVDMYCLQTGRFPLILMDISMPVMDGFTATKAIRKWEEETGAPRVPIIALTGHALKNDREACLEAGMDDYLTKPVKQGLLIEALEKHMSDEIAQRLAG